jgi:hypothetical protein
MLKFAKGDRVVLARVLHSAYVGKLATVRHASGRDGCMTVVLPGEDGGVYRPLPENVDPAPLVVPASLPPRALVDACR